MPPCVRYPEGLVRPGRWDRSLSFALGIPQNLSIDELCLRYSDVSSFSGFIMDSKGLAALLVGRPEARRGEEVLNMSSRYTYYEIYPSPHVRDWQNVHFGYTEHSNQERLGAACIAHVLKNPAEACSALPTCLGYTSDCLVGMSSANSSFIHGGKKNMNYYYHEKILEHAAISWIYENPIVSAFLVGIYILFVEVVYRKTRGAVYK